MEHSQYQEPAVIILAAGKGERMGGCKALTRLGGQTFLERIVAVHRQVAAEARIIVVTGAEAQAVIAHAASLGLETVHNPRFEAGMLTSVQAGLAAVDGVAPAVLLHPVDIPCVRPATIRHMRRAWAAQPDPARILLPVLGEDAGKSGHPPVIGAAHWAGIAAWAGPGGLAGYFAALPGAGPAGVRSVPVSVPVADEAMLMDADTPADLAFLEAWLPRMGQPTPAEAEALLQLYQTNPDVIAHCRAVALAARRLAAACGLQEQDTAWAAGLLHDIAKLQPKHARAGAELVREAGFGALEEAIALHPGVPPEDASLLTQLVALADKYASGDEFVDLETRFGRKARRFKENPEALQTIARRLASSCQLERRMAAHIGRPPLEVVRGALESAR
ncbi:NTP transferase domain-containing protein [Megalodesulfovibrio paquesii]